MPHVHTSTFKVRFYECDPYGHVNNANYLRYMQEAAFEASAAAGYDLRRYAQMGRVWYAHATDIEYVRPVQYGDTVEVKTWVADFRRVTSRRAYELYSAATGALVARATTDWAFLDAATQKPIPIPDELIHTFWPEGAPASFAPRERFPSAPPAPEGAYRLRKRVQWRECDSAGHVNNAVYAEWAEECGMQCIAHYRWPVTRMAEAGIGIFYRRMWIEYLRPALFDDEIEITAWLSQVKRATAMRHFSVTRPADGALLARINILGVCADVRSGAPRRIPSEMLDDFAPNIAHCQANGHERGEER
ncbi:MAG: YbgC/FadM family acyl-CoA thioesterase [Thermoflexales bacterium]|nr:YbgC/FadM family acyl-CoA thioesterase [Thermoflexales bacterium]MDW8352404.1 YbgC/FadM family acyl-CoA thioesterase [Anaerolineae bacterium]